jgi:phospholipid/cholesterol/gamma-HCH transport system ATP-binding protein
MADIAQQSSKPIDVRGLKKSFGEQTVLNGIDLSVDRGKTVAVLGRSGTGKSVLLKLLVGLQKPDSGSICIEGQEIQAGGDDDKLNEIRKKMGFVFQQAALYDSLTVEANVEFPLTHNSKHSPEERTNKVRELLSSVGLNEQDYRKMPSGISGGMQKRVGLARALALDPEILLLDEPTAGLDPITSSEIGELIVELKKKRSSTALVVTHDIRGAKVFSDFLVLLNEGSLVAQGTFDELQNSKDEFVARFFGEQQERTN